MSHAAQLYVWLVLPYVALALFVGGHVWRYRRDQLGWTSRSTQLLESRLLAWGSNLFHWGAIAVILGHVLGILVPKSVTEALGISESAYHHLAGIAGGISGLVCLAGLAILVYRRASVPRVRVTTTNTDIAVYVLLAAMIVLGEVEVLAYNVFGSGYDYRETVAPWFRSLFHDPQPELMTDAPVVYQLHAAVAWLLFALWPFSRLVHAWSIPFQYLGRPYVLYRRRYAVPARADREEPAR
ncbi:MAG TPA: respiratory nitrate reductase subunit gamma [Gaiellaceae bacterium]|nr:respiratory nitrate reductase subunit gamma [Gaiellaceae bacterium]